MRRIGDLGGENERSITAAALPNGVICPLGVAKDAMEERAERGTGRGSLDLSVTSAREPIPEQQVRLGEASEDVEAFAATIAADW